MSIEIIKVPTGKIFIKNNNNKKLEFLSIGDYGKERNIKANFLGLSKEINKVENGNLMSLTEKWVITISTQYGCSMNCKFCDVPLAGNGINISNYELMNQIFIAIDNEDILHTKRLNIHYARMGEPTFNKDVILNALILKNEIKKYTKLQCDTIHPVVSTMLPKENNRLKNFLLEWCCIKNYVYQGEAGLQFSINSTDDNYRDKIFGGSSLSLIDIAEISEMLPNPIGRKYTLNFAVDDHKIINSKILNSMFDKDKFIVKLTPIHNTKTSTDNKIKSTHGYTDYYFYKNIEEDLVSLGWEVLVFIPSQEEEEGRITCGNAILKDYK